MRHVMISRTLPSIILFCGLSHLVSTLPQERFLWSDPQLSSEEWHPFVPSNYPGLGERTLQTYPRADTIRQYFGKTAVEPAPIQNSPPAHSPVLKKSFQASSAPANNVDQYAIAPVLGSFNSFGVQTVQTRNPVFDKNIKDGQLLEQPTQYQFKYQPHPQQQVSTTVHRFPAYFPASGFEHFQRQPSVNLQHASFHGHAAPALAGNRYESTLKQGASRTPIATTIQVFPPPPPLQSAPVQHGQFGQNTFYLNVPPPPKEDYANNESPFDRKQARPNEYQSFNIYNTRNGNAQKSHVQQQSNQDTFFDNVKIHPTEKYEYDIISNSRPATFSNTFGNEHLRGTLLRPSIEVHGKKSVDESNPSKHVFEQLSPLGRPFTLSKDAEDTDPESLSSYSSAASRPSSSKKNKIKANQPLSNPVSVTYHRIPGGNGVSSLIDYESGKLQSVKTVNYIPQREVIRFNEDDLLRNNVLVYHPTSEKQPSQNDFLPTPIDSSESDDTRHPDPSSGLTYTFYNRFATTTTAAPPILDGTSQLPHNHKYSPANIRHRQPATSLWRQQQSSGSDDGSKYSFPLPEAYDDGKITYENVEYETTTTSTTSTTKRSPLSRRRKPAKLKNKNRPSVLPEAEPSSTTEENYPRLGTNNVYEQQQVGKIRLSYFDAEGNRNDHDAINAAFDTEETPATSTISSATPTYPVKKKHSKIRTTTAASDEEYPNYPLEYVNQQQSIKESYSTEPSDQQNVKQEEEREISKANYPTTSKPKSKPNFATNLRTSTSTTEGTLATTHSSIQKVRSKTKSSSTVTSGPVSVSANLTRPRFSIKDYKRTTTASPTSPPTPSAAGSDADSNSVNGNTLEIEKKENRKNLFALRNKTRNKITTSSDTSSDSGKAVTESGTGINDEEPIIRKYKPRIRPANKYSYKISTPSTTSVSNAAAVVTESTSERVNTFRPSSGGRIRSSTSKYYNRYRTTTEVSKNALSTDEDDRHHGANDFDSEDHVQASSSNIKPTRTLLFSAKKSTTVAGSSTSHGTTWPALNKVLEYEDEEDEDLTDDDYEDDGDEDRVLPPTKRTRPEKGAKAKKNHFYKKPTTPTKVEKADDISETSLMSSAEERNHKNGNKNSTQQYRPTEADKSEEEVDLSMITMDGKDSEVDQESESTIYEKTDDEQITSTTVSTSTLSNTNTESPTVLMTTTLSAEEQQESEDDVNERVSKVSLLTSQDESNRVNGVTATNNGGSSSYKHHWRFPVFSIKKISESDY